MLSPVDSHVDALCRQYPGVWPNFGEDMETVQGVHAARAGQESGRHALQFSWWFPRVCCQHLKIWTLGYMKYLI